MPSSNPIGSQDLISVEDRENFGVDLVKSGSVKLQGRVGRVGTPSCLSSTRIRIGTCLGFDRDQSRICLSASTKVGAVL